MQTECVNNLQVQTWIPGINISGYLTGAFIHAGEWGLIHFMILELSMVLIRSIRGTHTQNSIR